MNLKNAKEVKEKVEEVKKKRKPAKAEKEKEQNALKNKKIVQNVLKNEKNSQKKVSFIQNVQKNSTKNKKMTKKQKEKRKKFRRFLFKLFAIEYMTFGMFLLWAFGTNLVQTNDKLTTQLNEQHVIMKNLAEQVTELRVKPMAVKTIEVVEERIYLGTFKITHYCACKKCCGPNAQGITASGKRVEENKTIAVDPKVIELGSQVYIEGYGYMEAQDTGSAIKGNIIDVYVTDHEEALNLGVTYKDVYLVK